MSIAGDVPAAGGLGTFNLEHGFPEAVVRGFRSGFLTDYDYHHLTQCETLDGMCVCTSPSLCLPATVTIQRAHGSLYLYLSPVSFSSLPV